MAEKKRIVWIDQLRGLAFYFVVLGHMLADCDFKVWIYSFHMPLFFIISGFNLNFAKMQKTDVKDYIAHLASRMLIPYCWLQLLGLGIKFLLYLIGGKREIAITDYLLGIITGNSLIKSAASNAMYFVLLLFLAQLIIFFLIRLTKGNTAMVFAVILALTAVSVYTEGIPVVWHMNVVPTAMLFMFTGRFFMDCYTAKGSIIKKMKLPLCIIVSVILLVVGCLLAVDNGRASIHGNYFGEQYSIFFISAAFTSIAFALLVMLLPSTKLFNFIGKNTIFFLGIHEPFLNVVRTIFPEQWEKWWFVLIASIVCYFLPVPVAWLFNKAAPYICAMAPKENSLLIKISKFFALALVLAVPYVRFTAVFLDGALRQSGTMKLVAFLIFAAVVVGIERLFSLLLPVFFLQNKKEQKVAQTKKPVVYEDDDIMIIMPVEEI